MKKTTVVFTITLLSLMILLPLMLNTQTANAQNTNYTITKVDHKVEVLHSGNLVISDTLQITGQMPSTLQVGFPAKYAAYLLKSVAYDSNLQTIPLTLGMQSQGEASFYGAILSFPSGTSQTFTVVFIFTNNLLIENSVSSFSLDYPSYPTLTTQATQVTTTLDLPVGAISVKISKPDGAVNTTSYTKDTLPAFTLNIANATFSSDIGYIQKVTIPTLNRQITITPSGEIACTDTYKLINNATSSLSSFKINLSFNATNIVAKDQLGRTLTHEIQDGNFARAVNVTLALTMTPRDTGVITLDYTLPPITQQEGQYVLELDLFPLFDYYVETASVTVILPEGAQIVNPQLNTLGASADLTRDAYQQTLKINKEGVSYIDSTIPNEDTTTITYTYNPLWISLRPSTWMWAIAIVGSVVIAVYKRPKAPKTKAPMPQQVGAVVSEAKPKTGVSNEQVRAFADAYEEKVRLNADLASLDARAQKGRIPRQKYKAKRKRIELRIASLNQTIANIGAAMKNSGGNHAETAKQLENAETELNEIEQTTKAIQTRHNTGELALEDYRKQLEDLERRKTKAENTINGLLLRLR